MSVCLYACMPMRSAPLTYIHKHRRTYTTYTMQLHCAAAAQEQAVDLRDVSALTFRLGKMTAARRVAGVPQV